MAPHAGYNYSGKCAAYAYGAVDATDLERVVLLGPSHNVAFDKCAVPASNVAEYSTPLGNLQLDTNAIEALKRQPSFTTLAMQTDEEEHSLELHLPFIKYTLDLCHNTSARLLPIMVGHISSKDESRVAKLLEKYLSDPKSLVIISTDFCHWGKRFSFFWHDDQRFKSIAESVEALDSLAMDIMRKQDPSAFAEYLRTYKSTICGKHPLAILLHCLSTTNSSFKVRIANYDRSNTPQSYEDSSVSYVAALVEPMPHDLPAADGSSSA